MIAATWSLRDVEDVRAVWEEVAPPPYVSLASIAGIKPKGVAPADVIDSAEAFSKAVAELGYGGAVNVR